MPPTSTATHMLSTIVMSASDAGNDRGPTSTLVEYTRRILRCSNSEHDASSSCTICMEYRRELVLQYVHHIAISIF